MSLVTFFGSVATVVSIIQFAPQALRVHRHGVTGVAIGTWALFTVTTATWLGYALVTHQIALLVVNLVVGPMAWSILGRLALVPGNRARGVATFIAAVFAALTATAWPHVVVIILAAVEVVALLPQLYETFKKVDVSGVSSTTWFATALSQSLWGAYGIAAHQSAVAWGGFAGGLLAPVIAIRVLSRQRAAVSAGFDDVHTVGSISSNPPQGSDR